MSQSKVEVEDTEHSSKAGEGTKGGGGGGGGVKSACGGGDDGGQRDVSVLEKDKATTSSL